jgi:NADH-quinone oxidoreductase subunit G/[NiFe] hydrogenase diaphorase moiety small subunit
MRFEVEGMRTYKLHVRIYHQPDEDKTLFPLVRKARRHIIDLMLSEHHGECYSCVRNNNCELQSLAKGMALTDIILDI